MIASSHRNRPFVAIIAERIELILKLSIFGKLVDSDTLIELPLKHVGNAKLSFVFKEYVQNTKYSNSFLEYATT